MCTNVSQVCSPGKTTLISSTIQRLLEENHEKGIDHSNVVAYFYLKHNQSDKNTHNSVLRAIMEQIVSQDPVLADHLFNELASTEGGALRSTKKLESLIADSLGTFNTSYIVIDGLDEAASGEAEKSLKWLLSLVQGGLTEPTASLRVLFSGQRDGSLDTKLMKYPSVDLNICHEHEKDIQAYCRRLSSDIRQKFDLLTETEEQITSQVVKQSSSE